jgi:hypothetical protein
MVMAEDHVGDLVRVDAQCLQRVDYQRPVAHHAGVDDHVDPLSLISATVLATWPPT